MTPARLNLKIYQGATFRRVLRLTNAAGDPINLAGAVARMHIREEISSTTVLIALDDTNGRLTVTDEVGGEITLLIEDEDTGALNFTTGVYDLELEYSDNSVDRLLYGTVTLVGEVTREDEE